MIRWGINALNHGSSLAVFNEHRLVEYNVYQEDSLPRSGIAQALGHGAPDHIFWYENPWLKKTRQLRAGQWDRVFDLSVLPKSYLKRNSLHYAPVTYTKHHASHAAAGYYTSPFNHCAVVVLDAIGEWESATIWDCSHGEMTKVWSRSYPNSLGLFYSAFTKLVGLEPIKQEHLLEQMAAQGDPHRYKHLIKNYINGYLFENSKNMHRGINDWPLDIRSLQDQCDIAAAVQQEFERHVDSVMLKARVLTGAESLVYMGGCAMNSTANKKVVENQFKYIWSLPNPGDPSSSLGAVLYHTKQRVDRNWGAIKHLDIRI